MIQPQNAGSPYTRNFSRSLVCLVLAISPAVGFEPVELSFAEADADGDGSIDDTEAARHALLEELFEPLDIDSNGLVSEAEFATYPSLARQRQRTFQGID